MKHEEVLAAIRDVKDFPVPGIIFKDITTVLSNPEYLKCSLTCLSVVRIIIKHCDYLHNIRFNLVIL